MSVLLIKDLSTAELRLVQLTVDQYHQMIETGILKEGLPYELLDGVLVVKDRSARGEDTMTIGRRHRMVVDQILFLLSRSLPQGLYASGQAPVELGDNQEPEPDVAIMSGQPRDYTDRLPGPTDVLVVIEVADSSLSLDRATKQRIYADAGIPQYAIVNLRDEQVELHEQPLSGQGRYGKVSLLKRGQTVSLKLAGDQLLDVPATDWLP